MKGASNFHHSIDKLKEICAIKGVHVLKTCAYQKAIVSTVAEICHCVILSVIAPVKSCGYSSILFFSA